MSRQGDTVIPVPKPHSYVPLAAGVAVAGLTYFGYNPIATDLQGFKQVVYPIVFGTLTTMALEYATEFEQ